MIEDSGHITKTKPDMAKRFYCRTCNQGFTRKHNMVSHELIHTLSKPHICSVCSVKFRRIHDLKRHEKLHLGDRPFTCPKCHRGFARADALTRHQNSPHACAGSDLKEEEDLVPPPRVSESSTTTTPNNSVEATSMETDPSSTSNQNDTPSIDDIRRENYDKLRLQALHQREHHGRLARTHQDYPFTTTTTTTTTTNRISDDPFFRLRPQHLNLPARNTLDELPQLGLDLGPPEPKTSGEASLALALGSETQAALSLAPASSGPPPSLKTSAVTIPPIQSPQPDPRLGQHRMVPLQVNHQHQYPRPPLPPSQASLQDFQYSQFRHRQEFEQQHYNREQRFYHLQFNNLDLYSSEPGHNDKFVPMAKYQDLVSYTHELQQSLSDLSLRLKVLEDVGKNETETK